MSDIETLFSYSPLAEQYGECALKAFMAYPPTPTGRDSASAYVRSLNLASKGAEAYLLELVSYWEYRIGELFLLKAPMTEWYVYRMGERVYKITHKTGDKGYMIPSDARRLIIGVLFAGHKCKIIGHSDFAIIKI